MAKTSTASQNSMLNVDMRSFLEPRWAPGHSSKTFIQAYAGEFLSEQEVQKASHKRAHSFSHRTNAHSLYQGKGDQEYVVDASEDSCDEVPKRYASLPTVSTAMFQEVARYDRASEETARRDRAAKFISDHACETVRATCQSDSKSRKSPKSPDLLALVQNGDSKEGENVRRRGKKSRKDSKDFATLSHCQHLPPKQVVPGSEPYPQQLEQQLLPQPQTQPQQQPWPQQQQQQQAVKVMKQDVGCTIVLRNLPRCVTQNEVYDCLVEHGFEDDLVLLYVPWLMGRSEQANLGYAFVHLESHAAKQTLVNVWQGKYPFGCQPAARPINIALASVQGAKENMTEWNRSKKMARIRNPCFRPMVLKNIDGFSAN